ncbi:uncharacterized protein Z520_12279 [Fonsecaea multimorphosa CBS 102226]|uniref:AB hydrolase-1 domain-containing protein n=1 Tax=Fonsecaea multimorphosa CBS 102226 TaxID=1442371 RepID=A0A0D2K6K9_9EURO|nr:uncharacterized protein Z520_12279 [Fonsecaea multimorphosa CBS 102226]KIX92008.1 hypothetical protein Z520_12279 [Fonsecaea multimorphosa CBS 102226]OAL17365.1 hypothetical protein AYO22_11732 [Fonsecaea multimorphosa]
MTRSTNEPVRGIFKLTYNSDVSIYYELSCPPASDNAKPIIALSNPLAASLDHWDKFTDEFSPFYTILRYDSRFHGRSPLGSSGKPEYDFKAAASSLTMADLAQDLKDLLDHLAIPKLHALIGLSIGGGVALVFGAMYPELVEQVLVVGSRAKTDREVNETFDARIKFGWDNGTASLAAQSMNRWFPEPWLRDHHDEAQKMEKMLSMQSMEGYEVSVGALKKLDLWPYVEKVRELADGHRFLFMAGERDGSVTDETRAMAERAGSEVVILQGLGHMVNIEGPEAFHAAVRRRIA